MIWLTYRAIKWIRILCEITAAIAAGILGILIKKLIELFVDKGISVLTTSQSIEVVSYSGLVLLPFAIAKTIQFYQLQPNEENADVIIAAMHHLYEVMFGPQPGYRITFLTMRYPWSRSVRPRYRYAYGSGKHLKSRSWFRKGSALAGMAWELPGGDKFLLREIPDFGNDAQAFLTFLETQLNLTRKDALRFSTVTQRLRWIFCYGIVHSYSGNFIGVISIDSVYPSMWRSVKKDRIKAAATIIADVIERRST